MVVFSNILRASASASFASSLIFLLNKPSECLSLSGSNSTSTSATTPAAPVSSKPSTLASSSFDTDYSLTNALSLATTFPNYTFLPHKAGMKNGEGFLVVYSPKTRSPLFTVERLVSHGEGSGTSAVDKFGNKRPPFFTDPRLDGNLSLFQLTPRDYTNSGFDRGHMVPAADFSNDADLYNATFSMNNICPQAPNLNQGFWSRFENYIRRYLLSHVFEDVLILTGPVYAPILTETGEWKQINRMMGVFPKLVPVPTHFFKVVIGKNMKKFKGSDKYVVGAFLVPNLETIRKEEPLSNFLVKLSDLESLVGFSLLPKDLTTDDRKQIDSFVPDSRNLKNVLDIKNYYVNEAFKPATSNDLGSINNFYLTSLPNITPQKVAQNKNAKNKLMQGTSIHLCDCPGVDCMRTLLGIGEKD